MAFADVDICCTERMRKSSESNWEFVRENVGADIEICEIDPTNPNVQILRKTESTLNIAVSNKNMAYCSGCYYFEFLIGDVGEYSNFLAGITFKSLDGSFRDEYDSKIRASDSYIGKKASQYGVYLGGSIYNHENVGVVSFPNDKPKRLGVYVDTYSMRVAFMTEESTVGFAIDIKEKFPIDEHPLIYRDKIVVISPAVSMEAIGDVCTLTHGIPPMLPVEKIFGGGPNQSKIFMGLE